MMKWTINILIMISLFFTGCSKSMTTVNFREISIEPKFSIQHKEKIQAGIGLFLPQRFRDYNYQIEQHGIGKLANYEGNISIGRNTSLAFYQMMSSIFSHVVILEEYNRQIKLSDPDISFVAVPGIELFDFKVPRTGLFKNGMSKGEALRLAKISLLKGNKGITQERGIQIISKEGRDEIYNGHPFFWAPFILIGEWH
ncbi:MAG TPA: hypothetical protein PKW07_10565 [Syntrophorhabdaceae bacterium]|nr:hypothetical protein [Syntrophorhabdaceae bacterium]